MIHRAWDAVVDHGISVPVALAVEEVYRCGPIQRAGRSPKQSLTYRVSKLSETQEKKEEKKGGLVETGVLDSSVVFFFVEGIQL